MSSPYSQSSSSGGSVYSGKGSSGKPKAKKKPSHGLGHILGQTITDLKDVAVNLPGGLYHTAGGLVHHPVKTVEGIGKATVEDFRHPLRHPGYTLLDLAGIASVGAGSAVRIASAARLGRASELLRPTIPERVFKVGEGEVRSKYARTASTRLAQQAADKLHEKHPELRLPYTKATKVGKALTKQERHTQRLDDRAAQELVALSKGLNKAQRFSIRVVGEKTPLADRITHAEKMLGQASGREAAQLKAHLRLLARVKEYVHDVKTHDTVVPRFKPDQDGLIHAYEKARDLSHNRTTRAVEAGLLSKEGAAARAAEPRNIVRRDIGLNTDHVSELLGQDEPFYITYKGGKAVRKQAQVGSSGSIGVPRKGTEFAHGLTGATIRSGNISHDTPKTIAESTMGLNRYLSVVRQRERFSKMADNAPLTKHHIPIRPIWLKNKKWPDWVREHIDQIDNGNADEMGAAQRLGKLKEYIFPKPEDLTQSEMSQIKWIDKRLIGSANKPGPLATLGQHTGPRVALRTVDAINNATKLALVQLKVGYAVPNIGGNLLALTSQQGVFTPFNLARQALLSHQIGKGSVAAIDTLMGEGISRSLLGNAGIEAKIPEAVARLWNPIVDLPFRRAAFLHEAWSEGFKSSKQIEKLLNDHAHQHKLLEITDRANEAILDYSRLGPVEQDIIRRVIFLYPFVKASTLYAGHFLMENPIQSAIAGQIGAEQKLRRDAELGPVPSWAEALFKVGGSDSQPLVSNPAAIALLQTPAQLLETARRTFTGGGGSAYDVANMLNPALGAGLTALTRKDPFSGHDFGHESQAKIFANQLIGGIPARLLAERLRHGKYPDRTFPMGQREAILQFLLGTAAPRTANRAKLNDRAAKEHS